MFIGIGFIIMCLCIFIYVSCYNNLIKDKVELTATLVEYSYDEEYGYSGIYEFNTEYGLTNKASIIKVKGMDIYSDTEDINDTIKIYYSPTSGAYQEKLKITSYTPYFIWGLLLSIGAIISQKKFEEKH